MGLYRLGLNMMKLDKNEVTGSLTEPILYRKFCRRRRDTANSDPLNSPVLSISSRLVILKYSASINIEVLTTVTNAPAMKMTHWVESKSGIIPPRFP